MNWPISEAKIIPPKAQSSTIHRPRLLSLLDEILDYQLYLIIAPAGYGKSTLLTDWASRSSVPTCWYSLMTMDQDSHRFYAHFLASLRKTFPSFGDESMAMLEGLTYKLSSVEQFVITIANELSDHVREDFVFVLDDYHLVDEEEEINYFVSQFVQHASSACHLVLSSRTLLGLPELDLMVARGYVNGLGYEDLAFRPEEIEILAKRRFDHTLASEQAVELAKLTEGWITGLLLSANLQHWYTNDQVRLLKSSGVDLYTYFVKQVLDRQAPHIRDFLLRTSLFDEFDYELCSAIFGQGRSRTQTAQCDLIEHIRTNSLFVSEVGQDGAHLRYHPLFKDFLKDRFIREKPQEVKFVAKRLTDRYVANQQWEEAHQLLEDLADIPDQVDFIERHGQEMLRAGRMHLLVRWIDNLPQFEQIDHPSLMALKGAASVSIGATDYGISLLNQVENLLRTQNNLALLVRVLAYRSGALRLSGQYREALADADEALHLAERIKSPEILSDLADSRALCLRMKGLAQQEIGNPDSMASLQQARVAYQALKSENDVAVVSMEIGLAHLSAGDFRLALPLFEAAADSWRRLNNMAGIANVLNNLGYLHYLRGDYEKAADVLMEALHAAQRSGYRRIEAFALAGLADLLDIIELPEPAAEVYRQAADLADAVNERFLMLYIELADTRVAWSLQNWETAYRSLNRAAQHVLGKDSEYEWSLYHLTMGRYYLSKGTPEMAITPLEDAADNLRTLGRSIDLTVTLLFLGIAQAHSDLSAATQTLEDAIATASRSDCDRYLVAMGAKAKESLLALLDATDEGHTVNTFIKEVDGFDSTVQSLRQEISKKLFAELSIASGQVPSLIVQAMGKPEVWVEGVKLANSDWTALAARDLFFCLITNPDGLNKEEIGLLFWPDCTIKQLKTRFKNTIYRLRSAVPPETILFSDEVYRFNPHIDYQYDVEIFLTSIRTAQHAQVVSNKIEALKTALDQYRGPFLSGVDAVWVIAQREQLHRIFVEAGLELASLHLELDQARQALNVCHRIIAEEPCAEDAHRLAMRAHAIMGNRAEVADQFEKCRTELREDVDAEPSSYTLELFDTLMRSSELQT